ncbi:cyclic nucleotide-gated olfactory channel-like isoform X2 [Centruroides sculpturatus]|uniref:cyclic nucleotide-gated olfactory channel-like isoform X2 n=1 Tax=Centruroides sculpturatus TaxID=218467 RepID=UPI000C6CAED1|nr:cyclic nucleotide-gated olfactory channel-like isoform X2 [Centruroides sculpturatus]
MMKKLPLPSSLRPVRDPGKIVKYTPCSKQDHQLDDDLDEIAVVSNAAPENVKYGTGNVTANGPRVVPGIITSGGELSRLVAEKSTSNIRIHTSSPLYSTKSSEDLKSKSASRQSLLDSVNSKATDGDSKRISNELMAAYVNKAHVSSDLEISRKTRELRRKEIKREFEKWETSTSGSEKTGCNWSFVFDPSGRLCYYWSMIVSVAFLYNFWVMIYRFAFQEITKESLVAWFTLDYLADLLYILDIGFHFRTGYLEEGVLQTDSTKLRQHYMNSTMFYIDCLCLLPLDVLYLSIGYYSVLRCFRLVKIYRFWAFLDRTERHTNYPNVFRSISLIHYLLVIFHWNACLYHIISTNGGFGSRNWFDLRDERCDDVVCKYLHAFYWSTLALTTIGDLPAPRTKGEYLFIVLQLVFGLFLFAAVLGHVANIVTNVSAARKEFQAKLDAVKIYMRMRRVNDNLQNKVIKWFDYLWMTQKSSDEDRSVGCLPDKLKAEIAIHVHLDTLKRVEIFQNTEAGFLCELVLRLRPVLFSPGDYICRKGEVGKEMYIVNRGRLQVVTDNGKTVLATLRAGSYFGEISILNMGTAGNRRTASVRSVGYSDLFCLYKQDMWEVLKDYPAARVRLEAIAVKRLEKYKKEPLRKIAMGRSRSTPGLVESRGKIPLEETQLGPTDVCSSTATMLSETEPPVPPRDTNSPSTMRRRRGSSNCSACSRTSSQQDEDRTNHYYEPLGSMPHIIYPHNMQAYPLEPGLDRRLVISRPSISQTNLLSPMPSSPYYPQSPIPTTREVSPLTDYSPMSGEHHHHHHHHPYALMPPHFPLSICAPPAPPPPPTLQTSQMPRESSQEALLAEIKRLRERLVTLEAENATMSVKLSQQQWEVENRLAEIEMQICGGTNTQIPTSGGNNSNGDDNERNRESII